MRARLFGLLALMCLLFIVAGCEGGLFPPAPTPTPIPTATPTLAPTSTTVPTVTLVPTATPTLGPSVEESAYLAHSKDWMARYKAVWGRFSELQDSVNARLAAGLDAQTPDVTSMLADLKVIDDEVASYEAPAKFAYVHSFLKSAVRHYDMFSDEYSRGLSSVDPTSLQQASIEFAAANSDLERATSALPAMLMPPQATQQATSP